MKIIARSTTLLASAALTGMLVFAQVAPAAAADQAQMSGASATAKHAAAHRVEDRIKDLHQKLHIRADQAEQWNAFASVMRENAGTIRALLVTKSQNTASMSAVDDLRSYQDVAKAHVDGLARLIPSFEALYATMSDHQKKTADIVFAQHSSHDQHASRN